ncbi:MAG TPA: porin [Gemmataceae bacterium]|nr:porin [Gemmataceae bacterium]
MRTALPNSWRAARRSRFTLGLVLFCAGSQVFAQNQYPLSSSNGGSAPLAPPAFPQTPKFVAPPQFPAADTSPIAPPMTPLPPSNAGTLPLGPVTPSLLAPSPVPNQASIPMVPLAPPIYTNQPQPGLSVPPPPAADTPSNALIDARIKAYLDDQAKKKAEADARAKAEAEAKGTEVVNNVPISVTWNNSLFFSGADNAFRVRLGGYAQYDTSHWIQDSKTLPAAFGGNGVANEGVFTDGIFLRRVRIEFEGTLWENFEFQFYPEFEGVNRIQFDEMWFGLKEIPYIGAIRFGKDKIPTSMESVGSSKDVWFMERSEIFDAFNDEYGLGLYWNRNFLPDDRMSMQAWVGKWDIAEFSGNEGAYFDNFGYATAIRLTGLPVYECDGRYLVHLGCSFQYRQPNLDSGLGVFSPLIPTSAAAGGGTTAGTTNNGSVQNGNGSSFVRFRARPDMRDAVGIGGLTNTSGTSVIGYNDGDGTRLVDTGLLNCQNVCMVTPEFMVFWGRFSFLSEGSFNWIQNAAIPGATPTTGTAIGNQFYWGWYAQASCFLTGEQRTYNKRYGTYARVIPNTNAWLVRDEDGNFNGGLGAWEVLFRYDYINVNVNNNLLPGSPGVVAGSGILDSYTAGVNWHLNPNCRLMFNYTVAQRYIQAAAGNAITQGIGTRVHFQF